MRKIIALAALAVLAGCGGGGGTSSSSSIPNQAGSQQQSQATTTSFSVAFPIGTKKGSAKSRTPQVVSPNAASLDVLIKKVNGSSSLPSWVAADTLIALSTSGGSPNCTSTGSTETCTVTVPAPPGSVEYDFTVTDASKNPLANLDTTVTITQGATNQPTVTLQGVVASATVSVPTLVADTPQTNQTVTTTAFDASSAAIVDGTTAAPYANPYTLTVTDAGNQTTLSVTSAYHAAQSGTSVTVYGPSDVVKVTYSGRAINPFTITAGGTGFTAPDANVVTLPAPSGTAGSVATTVNDIVFTGTTLDDTAHGGLNTDPNYNQQTLFFAQTSGSQNVSATELGWTDFGSGLKFNLVLDSATCTNVASSSTTNPATTFTILAGSTPGICKAQLVEDTTQPGTPITGHPASSGGVGPTKDGVFWISVTSSSFTVNSKHRQGR